MSSTFIPNLQILRAFAATNVVVFHSLGNAGDYFGATKTAQFLGGWGMSGVDLFFVLSGFIMVHTQVRPDFSFKSFAIGRAGRIIPVYYVITAIVLALFFLAPGVFREASYDMNRIVTSFLFVSQFVLDAEPVVGYGWTLEYEMVFYAVLAALMVVGLRGPWSVLAGLIVFSTTLIYTGLVKPVFAEFSFGVMAAIAYRALRYREQLGLAVLAAGSVALVATIVWEPVTHRVLLWGVPATFVVLGAALAYQWNSPVLLFLGAASYAVYLVQILTVPGTMKVIELVIPSTPALAAATLAVIATLIGGSLIHVVVEKPALRLIRARRGIVPADIAIGGRQ